MINEFMAHKYDLIITFDFYLVPLLRGYTKKIIHWNDANLYNIYNFYPGYSNFPVTALQAAHHTQKTALEMSDIVIYSSDWAINTAINYYGIDKKKFRRILFASNLKSSLNEKEFEENFQKRSRGTVKFLFLAADWNRKGGDDAVALINELNSRDISSLLYVVGTSIPLHYQSNKAIVPFGFISKNISGGEQKIIGLLNECTFLLLPSRIDITPVAFSEANAFGLPIITTDIGGITSVVKDNINGCSLPVPSFVNNATEFVANHLPDSSAYRDLCYSSLTFYKENMAWDKIREEILSILDDLSLSKD
jgi:glycosyltransferase involved in cell wall biosynthesis